MLKKLVVLWLLGKNYVQFFNFLFVIFYATDPELDIVVTGVGKEGLLNGQNVWSKAKVICQWSIEGEK